MAVIALQAGIIMKVRHLLTQDGRYYYQRRVPQDLRNRIGRINIKMPLKTLDPVEASSQVTRLAALHDSLWEALRNDEALSPPDLQDAARALLQRYGLEEGIGLDHPVVDEFLFDIEDDARDGRLTAVQKLARDALRKPLPLLLSRGLDLYLDNHRKGSDAGFRQQATSDWSRLVAVTGDIAVENFTREHAKQVRDALLAQGMKTTSVRRRMNTFRAIFAAIRRETESSRVNPFEGLEIVGLGQDARKRIPFEEDDLGLLIGRCRMEDDERRRLIILLAFTGMRLSEALGLSVEDLTLDHQVPHLGIRRHPWRDLKTSTSARLIPLVGDALEVARRLQEQAQRRGRFLFPSYASEDAVKGNSASAALNKWIKSVIGKPRGCHELRHTMRDRLRHVGAPKDVIDAIGGWSRDSVGETYGLGHSLKTKADWLGKAYASLTAPLP